MGKILAVSVLLFSALTLTASAQIPPDYGIKETANAAGLPTGQPSISTVTAGIINTLLGIVGALAVVLIIYAGFLWMTSAGNEEKISTAKKLLAGSVIGLLIIFSAYAIALFVVKQIAESSGVTHSTAN
jgi:TRAP-type C4-dicarboxylate transport system permease small subunit